MTTKTETTTEKPATLYQACLVAGLPVDNHESDLYVLASEQARVLVKEYKQTCTSFVSQIEGKVWLEIPFAFDPFWAKKDRK